MFEVAEAWYTEFIPQIREILEKAKKDGKKDAAEAAGKVVEEIMSRPEHKWPEDFKKPKDK
ncbi:MAG: hypothetical protein K8T20_06615 [Planctomycetes bacterium]|nr:hypothetical protein [Planctomycetota bacterium]